MNRSSNATTLRCLILCTSVWVSFPTTANTDELPALPPLSTVSDQRLPGKFVWADLVSGDVAKARIFYQEFLGLEWQPLVAEPIPYGLLLRDGVPFAGLAGRSDGAQAARRSSHWVHFMSVDSVAAAEAAMLASGGAVVLDRREYRERGTFAVTDGPGWGTVGFIRSSGDPPDYRAETGDWIWRELLSDDPAAAAELYRQVCRCDVSPRGDSGDRFLLSSQGFLRSGISPVEEEGGDAVWLGFVRVSDVSQALESATGLGARVLVEPNPDILAGGLAVIEDPVGAPLGLMEWEFGPEEMNNE